MKIQILDASMAADKHPQLVGLLLDALAHGASMGLPPALTLRDAEDYWRAVRVALAGGTRVLLAATHEGRLAGTVQLELYQRANCRDGAEVQKMMVHSHLRRRGIGSVLLRAAEAETREMGRSLLFLDTEAGSGAEALYHGLGYTRVDALDDAQDHALAAGCARPTAIYYKSLLMPELA
jgi:acetyltransferase